MRQYCVSAYEYLFSDETKQEEDNGNPTDIWENFMRDLKYFPEGPIKNALRQLQKNRTSKKA
ncbi:hypothetical protein COMNV_01642 [Commensalibacter sp. Nvir]|nr:hypothetical protein COMNV_01642 [Commensalibacter sp. Nvir]